MQSSCAKDLAKAHTDARHLNGGMQVFNQRSVASSSGYEMHLG